jgi:hypothetical protein
MTGPIGADHYVVVLDVDDDRVLIHDPQGYPYAEVPINDFMTAWRADTVNYGDPYTMRTDFVKVADVSDADAIRSIIPSAIEWLSMRTDPEMPPGSLGNGEAAERVADMIEAGAGGGLREHLIYFAIRVGARRLGDTADCLALAGYTEAAAIAATQARLVGSMQHPMVTGIFRPRRARFAGSHRPTADRSPLSLKRWTPKTAAPRTWTSSGVAPHRRSARPGMLEPRRDHRSVAVLELSSRRSRLAAGSPSAVADVRA